MISANLLQYITPFALIIGLVAISIKIVPEYERLVVFF